MERKRECAIGFVGARVRCSEKAPAAFGSGTMARAVYPKDGAALARAVAELKGQDFVVLGGATNVLFPDGTLEKTVVFTTSAKDVTRKGSNVYCCAGARLPAVVAKCADYALSGAEQLAGIPGTVGGAIAMNAGAFGREIAELVVRVDAVTSDGRVVALGAQELHAGYRHTSVTESGLTVLGAELKLCPSSRREIRDCVAGYADRRRESQPQGRSLGSVFKRADGVSAGYYIEKAGLKGATVGGARISERHANFILNVGEATSADFVALAERARREVKEKFGKELEYEVIFL